MELISRGHSVGDLFGRYVGGTLGIAAILNLDGTVFVNGNGIVLKDLQDLIGGIGAQVARRDLLIQPRGAGPANVVIKVTSEASNQTIQQSATLNQVLSKQLK